MPRTRPELQRADKANAIADAAARRLRHGGYEALKVSGIARELGLAQNTLYWYFPTKDELFVAGLRRLIENAAAEKPPGTTEIEARILWFTDQFEILWRLGPALRVRAAHSEGVANFVDEVDALVATLLRNALSKAVVQEEIETSARLFRAVVEGTYAQGLPASERHEILRLAFARLVAGPP